ncbi:MAG: PEP-CTERM sorting domain-containing protein, partial [Chromatiaceae bacterium]|nr:PEP-CTERM sorting domain-containing protein [Chromatiaceae bacterium]
SSCAEAGAPSGCVGFQTQEGLANNVQFQFAIRQVPIPVPGPLALMGVGLLGLGAARRFRPAC